MRKIIFTLFIITTILLSACTTTIITKENNTNQQEPDAECLTDSDCISAGCSGQLCLPKDIAGDIATTCEFKPEYECLQFTSCGCNQGKCGLKENEAYAECMASFE